MGASYEKQAGERDAKGQCGETGENRKWKIENRKKQPAYSIHGDLVVNEFCY